MGLSMRLGELFSGLVSVALRPQESVLEIRRVTADSRRVEEGDLFVAVKGPTADGHAFIDEAFDRGASVVLCEHPPAHAKGPVFIATPTAALLGELAARLEGNPGKKLIPVGVTGTNGKTTTTFLIEAILRQAGGHPGLIGTVRTGFGKKWSASALTTPGSVELQSLIAGMVQDGATHVVMEVSSIALDQSRTAGLPFRVAAFTNLTRDHLDYHPTMEAYFSAKLRLFVEAIDRDVGTSVICVDTAEGETLAKQIPLRVLRCASRVGTRADVAVEQARFGRSGVAATVVTPRGSLEVTSPLLAEHNLQNIVVAIGVAEALGLRHDDIAHGIASLSGVPGRLERVPTDGDAGLVLVDYAHTPDALERALAAVRPLVTKPGKLRLVFGCGGDRDPGKRPIMGGIAASFADETFVTSDNPRTEDPASIVAQIVAGVAPGLREKIRVAVDRSAAIRRAIAAQKSEDALLIAGKGHEDYQIIGTKKFPFDDREQALAALAGRQDPARRDGADGDGAGGNGADRDEAGGDQAGREGAGADRAGGDENKRGRKP